MIAFSIISTTFAMPIYANEYSYSDNKENYQINVINENAVTVSSKAGIERIIVTENDTNRKVSVQNMDTGEQNYFVLNKEENTMYSSITGKKTYIENQELRAKQSSNTLIEQFTFKHYRYRMGKRRVYKTDNFVTSVARY